MNPKRREESKMMEIPRFDGAAAWATLSAEQQVEIGAIALEFIVSWHGLDSDELHSMEGMPRAKAFGAADSLLGDMLMDAVSVAIGDAVPALSDDGLPVPIPSLLGPICCVCGCSEAKACEGGCAWAGPNLCTACIASGAVPHG